MNKLLQKDQPFHWDEEQENAFNLLKHHLITSPIIRYPDFERPFIVYTDASGTGLGAVLQQKDDKGQEYVVAYASRSLSKAEQNYAPTELECLAIIWAIEHFHYYLGTKEFTLITDHSALQWLQNKTPLKGKYAQWVLRLQPYNFKIIHRPGRVHNNADALSRIEYVECNFLGMEKEESHIIIDTDTESDISEQSAWGTDEGWTWDAPLTEEQNRWDLSSTPIEMQITQLYETPAYTYSNQELEAIFQSNIVVKQVIAGQPITHGGSRCDHSCDFGNHHIHTYCKACKTNLFYETTIHECKIGIGIGL